MSGRDAARRAEFVRGTRSGASGWRDLAHNPSFSSQVPAGWSAVAENVGWYDGPVDAAEVARLIHEEWMKSPGHRANLLNPAYTHIGVGVAHGSNGWYLTQNFGAY